MTYQLHSLPRPGLAHLSPAGIVGASRRTVLIVDEDAPFRESLCCRFRMLNEFVVLEAQFAREALEIALAQHLDAAIIAFDLSDFDGRELCRLFRRRGLSLPIILLGQSDSDVDAILSLDAGANDFVSKPPNFGVLLARLRARLRESEEREDASFVIGPYMFLPAVRLLIERETKRRVHLTEKEAGIIKYLVRHRGKTVARERMLAAVWGYQARLVDTHTVETHVHRLRKKIERGPGKPRLLVTVPGGYRLGDADPHDPD